MGQSNPGRNPSFWEKAGSPVYWAWLDEVMAGGGEVPRVMLNKKSQVVDAGSFSWWTPSELMDLPGANNFQEAAELFFKTCQVVSLAPDWYVWGGAGISLKWAGRNPIRPTPLDGLNPLWVQHPADEKARTGGGAEEVLIEGPIGVVEVLPIRIYPLDQSTHKALKAAPSVDTYANNLCLARPPGRQPDADRVAFWQVTIVKQCRESRANADEQFTKAAFDATCGCQGTEGDARGQL